MTRVRSSEKGGRRVKMRLRRQTKAETVKASEKVGASLAENYPYQILMTDSPID